jgi:tRNA uridine 5-carboxymethylaminomethyl modification enzyme
MIDDLTTRGVTEPYRMFTSRAEYRLSLRADNADLRLTETGISIGCVGAERAEVYGLRRRALTDLRLALEARRLTPNAARQYGMSVREDGKVRDGMALLALPGVGMPVLRKIWPDLPDGGAAIDEQIEIEALYAPYEARQEAELARLRNDETLGIPRGFPFTKVEGLSSELVEKLSTARPADLAQASRIEGMTPSAMLLLSAAIRRGGRVRDGGSAVPFAV